MSRKPAILALCLAACVAPLCAIGSETAAPVLRAVVTTSLIETALRDLLGERVEVVRLMPAGSCPGHFDIEPSHAKALRDADVFVRHDFQAGLDRAAQRAGAVADRTISVTSLPAFTIPSNYVAMCTELAAALKARRPEWADGIAERLAALAVQAEQAAVDAARRAEAWKGRRVLAAHYQRDFCEWAGLSVVAVFHAGADESAWLFNRAVDMAKTAGAEAVIGNLQWGQKHLKALEEATGLPGAMLSNFPAGGEAGAYWNLLQQNLEALERLWHGAGH